MFKVGDLVYLRPISIHTPGVLDSYDIDIRILQESYDCVCRGGADHLEWFVRDYIDWNTECFLSKSVYIVGVSDCDPDSVAIYGIHGDDIGYYNTWWIRSAALEPMPIITQTRRLTVKKGIII